jgi:hypothetical protein
VVKKEKGRGRNNIRRKGEKKEMRVVERGV